MTEIVATTLSGDTLVPLGLVVTGLFLVISATWRAGQISGRVFKRIEDLETRMSQAETEIDEVTTHCDVCQPRKRKTGGHGE